MEWSWEPVRKVAWEGWTAVHSMELVWAFSMKWTGSIWFFMMSWSMAMMGSSSCMYDK